MKNKKPKKLDEGYTQILLENINSKVELIAEQYSGIKQNLEDLNNKSTKHDEDIQVLTTVARSNSKDIKELKENYTKLEAGQTRIENKLDLKFNNHEKRILKIEGTVLIR